MTGGQMGADYGSSDEAANEIKSEKDAHKERAEDFLKRQQGEPGDKAPNEGGERGATGGDPAGKKGSS